ncbi:5'-_3' exoribonculease Dhp1 [Aspergillus clavatus NRRL 1]|uniref:5'-3' exoribonuclease n=1 Tax=Aspergillus clavatus (strain ATCC 1007 / CBS 513.65 / DSM 816 / NCTC 3887 / NRRL 1 / QM 1276 / 107) TaxID=344612 RepID=A1CP86_ASPCL|nr:5'->3' exoribonculease Dhp1 [Aspergillus clavatus NRRL 1]EAW07457.1 5'->3' exoribonculease Dhp1 [Aspergillus clavatus NRRL 1]
MGVPALFRWLSNKYPKIISSVIEELPYEVNGEEIPVDTTKPNPNGEEMDNLYLDMNGIVHPCTHPEGKPPPANEQEMMVEIFKYTDRVVNMVRPRKVLMIAVDGVAPRAKMNQQRARRFRSAQEAREADEKKEEFRKMLAKQNGNKADQELHEEVIQKTWDSNVITPGTPFMDILAASLRYWIAYKLNTDPAWEKLKIIISDATVPGEGEHKIMEFVRSQRAAPEHDPNTRHVIYGLDADLIMLGLATHEPHFRVLREDVFFQESRPRTCNLCGQPGHKAEECRGQAKEKNGEFDEKQKGSSLKPFIWLHVSVLREYLAAELYVPQQPFPFDLERALDDWVFMCFFVGNDFLPHLPSLDIRENGIDTLIAIWRDNIPVMGGYLTEDGHVDLKRAQLILQGLAKQEDAIFRRRRQAEERKLANEKRRKQEAKAREEDRASKRRRSSPNYDALESTSGQRSRGGGDLAPPTPVELITPGRGVLSRETRELTHSMVVNRSAVYKANMANKSAAAVLKSKLMKGSQDDENAGADAEEPDSNNGEPAQESQDPAEQTSPSVLGKRNVEVVEEESADAGTPVVPAAAKEDELPPDTVRLWEEGYADRYYAQKFGVGPEDKEFRHKVARAYAEGLAWVLLYYFQGCPSWTWYFPYHYAPFAADFVDIGDMEISFDKGIPFRPFEQLMGVLPASSNHAIPEVFHDLMSNPSSEIIDFYPEDFAVDLNGKKFAWQGVILLPFIDERRLLAAMEKKYPLLSEDEKLRNSVGRDVLLISEAHPLYQDLVGNFYSKKQDASKYKLNMRISDGLAGRVERNDAYIPHSSLVSSLEEYGMPSLDDDRSLIVNYEIPKSSHVHKSMLLRGVKFGPPALDNADIQAVKHRAQHSGRSYGGAPFRGGNRGGRINYASDRPNPFAAHLDPSFMQGAPGNAGEVLLPLLVEECQAPIIVLLMGKDPTSIREAMDRTITVVMVSKGTIISPRTPITPTSIMADRQAMVVVVVVVVEDTEAAAEGILVEEEEEEEEEEVIATSDNITRTTTLLEIRAGMDVTEH